MAGDLVTAFEVLQISDITRRSDYDSEPIDRKRINILIATLI